MKHSENTSTQDSAKYSMEVKLNVDPEVSPSLVLDLNNTDTQQMAWQHSFTPTFHIDRECNLFKYICIQKMGCGLLYIIV